MSANEKTPAPLRIQLTAEQKAQIKQATGKEVSAVQFTAEELEDRIAPLRFVY